MNGNQKGIYKTVGKINENRWKREGNLLEMGWKPLKKMEMLEMDENMTEMDQSEGKLMENDEIELKCGKNGWKCGNVGARHSTVVLKYMFKKISALPMDSLDF